MLLICVLVFSWWKGIFTNLCGTRILIIGRGDFFVTIQVAHNVSLLGVIVGERVVLNELGGGYRMCYWGCRRITRSLSWVSM